jgi:hypothetical protein
MGNVYGGVPGTVLHSIGIPKDSVVKYEGALETDQFVPITHGTPADVINTNTYWERRYAKTK